MPKLTYEYVKEQVNNEGYLYLNDKYVNSRTKFSYECPEGHRHSISWNSWQQGHRCPYCAGQGKPTIEFVRSEFKKDGYTLLATEYKNAYQKLNYICPNEHNHFMNYHNWHTGYRCPTCYRNNNVGSNHPMWKGGITPEVRMIRASKKYKEWRALIFERDNFICQKCEQVGGNLNAHHIEDFSNNPELRTTIENGITLCEECHKDFHHQYGYGNNTRIQIEEFLGQTNL